MSNFLRFLIIIIGLVFLFESCAKPLQPEYLGFNNLTIYKVGINESIISADVKFYNPNSFKLQLKHADVILSLDNKQAAHCIIDSTIQIPKLDSFYIPVSLKISLGSIISNALQFIMQGKTKVNADGFVKLRKTGLGFKFPIHYEGYQRLDSLLQTIR